MREAGTYARTFRPLTWHSWPSRTQFWHGTPTEVTLHLTFRRRHTLQAVGALARLSTRETGRETGDSDSRGRAASIIQVVRELQQLGGVETGGI